jgi:erythronate-4-phosphate dehydrogenase
MAPNDPIIVVDAGIPYAEELLGPLGSLRRIGGDTMDSSSVRDADAVIVRSITRVDERLLGASSVGFVGTATTGTDHIDRIWLQTRGIRLADAAGANAESVADYIVAAALHLAASRHEALAGRTAGVIGVGRIGRRVARRLAALGMDVLLNDPPRARRARTQRSRWVTLDDVLDSADLVTVHVPLVRSGADPTFHLVSDRELRKMKRGAWFVNTSRGPVLDNQALYRIQTSDRRLGACVLDVWENEPLPSRELIDIVDIATPHIAGYAAAAKWNATAMMAAALRAYLGLPGVAVSRPSGNQAAHTWPFQAPSGVDGMDALARRAYDIMSDDRDLRATLRLASSDRGAAFERLRSGYGIRPQFSDVAVLSDSVPSEWRRAVFSGLGLRRA